MILQDMLSNLYPYVATPSVGGQRMTSYIDRGKGERERPGGRFRLPLKNHFSNRGELYAENRGICMSLR
jgi:hypothetical protein